MKSEKTTAKKTGEGQTASPTIEPVSEFESPVLELGQTETAWPVVPPAAHQVARRLAQTDSWAVRRQTFQTIGRHYGNQYATQLATHVQRKGATATPPAPTVPDAYTDEEAAKVKANWATGVYKTSDSGDQQPSKAYYIWKDSTKALLKKSSKTLSAAQKKELADWIVAYEAHEAWTLRKTATEPATPADLSAAVTGATVKKGQTLGAAPSPAFSGIKTNYKVTMPGVGGATSTYQDNPVRPTYEYLTNATGVARGGQKVGGRKDLEDVYKTAGISDATVKKVMNKVSTQEGGFEAVNTYDTGYVSVGFIQFVTGEAGQGSVLDLLKRMKKDFPDGFNQYFRPLGIEVDGNGLVVVDPATGTQLRGKQAVRKIMDDKRLTAVFYEAGLHSQEYQATQLKIAYNQYYYAAHSFNFSVKVDNKPTSFSGKYEDVLKSEAGKTAIMDRAVQRGAGSAEKEFKKAATALIQKHKLTTVEQLAGYEIEIIPHLVNRIHVLSESDLSQPAAVPPPTP